jgi:hypothetical protein
MAGEKMVTTSHCAMPSNFGPQPRSRAKEGLDYRRDSPVLVGVGRRCLNKTQRAWRSKKVAKGSLARERSVPASRRGEKPGAQGTGAKTPGAKARSAKAPGAQVKRCGKQKKFGGQGAR